MKETAMKAAIMRDYGDPQVLDYGDLPTPEPGAGEVLVRVLAAGLNRLDHYIREDSVTRDLHAHPAAGVARGSTVLLPWES
jgi:NADPH:quinone reductase-like Zn-dependent oxidoreductase